jgi:hypothetical protein
LAVAMSLGSLGSSQTLRLPHFKTAAANRFWTRRLALYIIECRMILWVFYEWWGIRECAECVHWRSVLLRKKNFSVSVPPSLNRKYSPMLDSVTGKVARGWYVDY